MVLPGTLYLAPQGTKNCGWAPHPPSLFLQGTARKQSRVPKRVLEWAGKAVQDRCGHTSFGLSPESFPAKMRCFSRPLNAHSLPGPGSPTTLLYHLSSLSPGNPWLALGQYLGWRWGEHGWLPRIPLSLRMASGFPGDGGREQLKQ